MGIAEIVLFGIAAIALFFVVRFVEMQRAKKAVESWADRKGIELLHLGEGERDSIHQSRYVTIVWYTFRFRARSKASGDRLVGTVRVTLGTPPHVDFEYDNPPKVGSSTDDAPVPVTREDEIRAEVNRRLDALTEDPEEMMRYDINVDGKVDAEEWGEARAKIEAEVRAEFGDREVADVEEVEEPGESSGHW